MKKILFVMAALLGCIMVTNAQSTLVATLTHGSDVSMFYGTYALRDALEKAESGDVINLSDGAFQAADITKAVTLRGAGIAAAKPTFIVQGFDVNIPSDDVNRFTMEGIRCTNYMRLIGTFKDPSFTKCQFDDNINIGVYNEDYIDNALFANCKITDYFYVRYGTAQFVNSYLKTCGEINNNSSATFLNCVIYGTPGYLSYSQIYNSILFYPGTNKGRSTIPTTSLANNCLGVNYDDPFSNLTSSPGCTTATFAEVFKDFTGEYSDEQTFELTEEAQKKYLGNDGTQMGIYGGILPYTPIPSYPQFTKMNVSGKTTTDGKLSVEIGVGEGK